MLKSKIIIIIMIIEGIKYGKKLTTIQIFIYSLLENAKEFIFQKLKKNRGQLIHSGI